MPTAAGARHGGLEVEGVALSYDGAPLLASVDLEVAAR